jgi:hypothetical protein
MSNNSEQRTALSCFGTDLKGHIFENCLALDDYYDFLSPAVYESVLPHSVVLQEEEEGLDHYRTRD